MSAAQERNRQVVRQWTLLQQLQSRPRTLKELAGALGVTDRTIRRDLDALEEAEFPLYNDQHDDGAVRWHLLTPSAVPYRGGLR